MVAVNKNRLLSKYSSGLRNLPRRPLECTSWGQERVPRLNYTRLGKLSFPANEDKRRTSSRRISMANLLGGLGDMRICQNEHSPHATTTNARFAIRLILSSCPWFRAHFQSLPRHCTSGFQTANAEIHTSRKIWELNFAFEGWSVVVIWLVCLEFQRDFMFLNEKRENIILRYRK